MLGSITRSAVSKIACNVVGFDSCSFVYFKGKLVPINTTSSDRTLFVSLNCCFAVSSTVTKEAIIAREADMALVYKITFYIILIYLI